jgi:hypothetical protein
MFSYIVIIKIFFSGGVQAFPGNLTMMGFLDLPPPTTMTNLPDRCFSCNEQKQSMIN